MDEKKTISRKTTSSETSNRILKTNHTTIYNKIVKRVFPLDHELNSAEIINQLKLFFWELRVQSKGSELAPKNLVLNGSIKDSAISKNQRELDTRVWDKVSWVNLKAHAAYFCEALILMNAAKLSCAKFATLEASRYIEAFRGQHKQLKNRREFTGSAHVNLLFKNETVWEPVKVSMSENSRVRRGCVRNFLMLSYLLDGGVEPVGLALIPSDNPDRSQLRCWFATNYIGPDAIRYCWPELSGVDDKYRRLLERLRTYQAFKH